MTDAFVTHPVTGSYGLPFGQVFVVVGDEVVTVGVEVVVVGVVMHVPLMRLVLGALQYVNLDGVETVFAVHVPLIIVYPLAQFVGAGAAPALGTLPIGYVGFAVHTPLIIVYPLAQFVVHTPLIFVYPASQLTTS